MTSFSPLLRDPGPCPYAANPFHLRGWDVMRGSIMCMEGMPSPFKEDRADGLYKLTLDWRNYMEGQQACHARFIEINPIATMHEDPAIMAACDAWDDGSPVTEADVETVINTILKAYK